MKHHDNIQIGDLIDGKYRVVRVLGRGGMGVVVEALHLRLGTSVAIKVLATAKRSRDDAPGLRGDQSEALVREAQVSARLRSEHVARVFDVGFLDDGTPFVVMEHLTGCTLHEAMYGGGEKIPVERAVELVLEACDAVAEAHTLGIIHRDLKPANLFLARLPNGRDVVKVLDFGIAKLATDAKAEERVPGPPPSDQRLDALCTGDLVPGTVLAGTPQYMPPEHFDRVPRITVEGDVWSLGVILYELLAGRRPYECKQLLELIWRVTSTPPTMLREIRPDIDPGLERIVMTCLSRHPEARFRRVEDLADAIRPFAGALGQRLMTRSVSIAPGGPSHYPSLAPTVETATIAIGSPRAPRRLGWGGQAGIVLSVIAGIASAAWLQRAAVRHGTPPAPAAAPPSTPVMTAATATPTVVVMGGSSTVAELAKHWVPAIAASRKDVVLQVQSTSTAAGLGALLRREVDLVGASRPATDEELALARAGGVELVGHVVARDGLAVVVHPDNPADALSMEQLRGVLTGRIRSWSSIGGGAKGASRPIHVLARPEDQGSSEILRNLVLRHGDVLADNVEVVRRSDDAVARVKNDPNAVTFVTFRDVGAAKTLKLRIGTGTAVAPSTGTIRSEHYPLRRDLFVYTRTDARREAVDVLAFIEGPGRRVVSESGFVPPPDAP